MTKASSSALLLLSAIAGCSNRPSERIAKVAEYYVAQLADTSGTDSSAAIDVPPLGNGVGHPNPSVGWGTEQLDSATADWTVAEWEKFWEEVDRRRRR